MILIEYDDKELSVDKFITQLLNQSTVNLETQLTKNTPKDTKVLSTSFYTRKTGFKERIVTTNEQERAIANEYGQERSFVPGLSDWVARKGLQDKFPNGIVRVGYPPNTRVLLGNSRNRFVDVSYDGTIKDLSSIINNIKYNGE